MGFLAKRKTKRLMAPDVVQLSLDPQNVLALAEKVARSTTTPKAGLINGAIGRELRIDFDNTDSASADITLHVVSSKTGDLSKSVFHNRQLTIHVAAHALVDGGSKVHIETTQAVTTDDKIAQRKTHEAIREDLLVALQHADPEMRVVVSRHGTVTGSAQQ